MIKIKSKKKFMKFIKSLHGWKRDLVLEALSVYTVVELEKTKRLAEGRFSDMDGKE